MKKYHYPVQITTIIKNKDNNKISDFIKSIDYKITGEGEYDDKAGYNYIQYQFSYTNAIKFMRLLQDLGYSYNIRFLVKVIMGEGIYK